MPRIMRHHAEDPWRPLLPWPDDCGVQWGGHGIVLGSGDAPSYGTAFFEAFPGDGGFIRGEGKTVEEAEADAFAIHERERGCGLAGGHAWSRNRILSGHQPRMRKGKPVPRVSTYLNGGAFCRRCGAFKTVFRSVPELGAWRRPLTISDLDAIMSGMVRPNPSLDAREGGEGARDSAKWRRGLALRARFFGIDLPDHSLPEYARKAGANPFKDDAYTKACRVAVVRYYIRHREALAAEGGDGAMSGLFDGLSRRRLDREAEDYLAREGAA